MEEGSVWLNWVEMEDGRRKQKIKEMTGVAESEVFPLRSALRSKPALLSTCFRF